MRFLKHHNRYELPADCDPASDIFIYATVGGVDYMLQRISVDEWAKLAKDNVEDACGVPVLFAAFTGKDIIPVMMVFPKPDADIEARGRYTPHMKPL